MTNQKYWLIAFDLITAFKLTETQDQQERIIDELKALTVKQLASLA